MVFGQSLIEDAAMPIWDWNLCGVGSNVVPKVLDVLNLLVGRQPVEAGGRVRDGMCHNPSLLQRRRRYKHAITLTLTLTGRGERMRASGQVYCHVSPHLDALAAVHGTPFPHRSVQAF